MTEKRRVTGRARTRALTALREVDGIGNATAERLIDRFGVTTVAGLLEAEADGRLAELPGVTAQHCEKVRRSAREVLGRPPADPPRRVPTEATTVPARRSLGAGALLALPLLAIVLYQALSFATSPLHDGLLSVLENGFAALGAVPLVIIIGGIAIQGFRGWTGHDRADEFPLAAGVALGVSVVGIFVTALFLAIAVALGAPLFGLTIATLNTIVGIFGAIVLLGGIAIATFTGQERKRRHERPPPPPWENPLARTEPASMVVEALIDQHNIIALGAMVALSIVLWNPLPLLIAGGLELPWLALAPDTKWFRKRVERKHRALAEEQAKEYRAQQLDYLTDDQRDRHHEMMQVARTARDALEAAGNPFDTEKIDRLVHHHVWLMQLENYYDDQRDPDRIANLREELENVRSQHEQATGRVGEVLGRRVDVLERRIDHLAGLEDRLDEVTDERRKLEDALRLVAESALSTSGPGVAAEIDDVLCHLETTEEVVLDFRAAEDELEHEIEEAAAAAAR